MLLSDIAVTETIIYGNTNSEFETHSKYLGQNVVLYDTEILQPTFACTLSTFFKLGTIRKYYSDLQHKSVVPRFATIHVHSDDFSSMDKVVLQFIQLNRLQWKKIYS